MANATERMIDLAMEQAAPADANPFTGRLAEEYGLLTTICPNAAELTRRFADRIGSWRRRTSPAGSAGGPLLGIEIGCGTGRSTLSLLESRSDLKLVAIDSSAAMLEQAEENLAQWVDAGRVVFIDADALDFLKSHPDASAYLVVSNYAIHNFEDDYRRRVHAEIFRLLEPGGLFVNADRYAFDDPARHLAETQADLRRWFRIFEEMQRYDLLEDWVVHLFGDESPQRIIRLTPALEHLREVGFAPVNVEFREGVDTLVTAGKP